MRGGAGDRHASRRYLSQHCGKEGCSRKGAGRLGRWVPHEGHGPRRYLGFGHCLKVLLVSLTHVNLALPHFLSYSKVYEESG